MIYFYFKTYFDPTDFITGLAIEFIVFIFSNYKKKKQPHYIPEKTRGCDILRGRFIKR
jgi:hypothetical protein